MQMSTAYRIREYREKLNMTQEELSRKANVSRSIISELETGRRFSTNTETLVKIAKALNVSLSQIFLK